MGCPLPLPLSVDVISDSHPKFSNFDLNGSTAAGNAPPSPRRFSKHPSSWGQQNQSSLGVPTRLSFGINTKYTSVFGNNGRGSNFGGTRAIGNSKFNSNFWR